MFYSSHWRLSFLEGKLYLFCGYKYPLLLLLPSVSSSHPEQPSLIFASTTPPVTQTHHSILHLPFESIVIAVTLLIDQLAHLAHSQPPPAQHSLTLRQDFAPSQQFPQTQIAAFTKSKFDASILEAT